MKAIHQISQAEKITKSSHSNDPGANSSDIPTDSQISCSSRFSSHSFVLRRGLKKNQEFLGLYSILRTLFPRRSSTFGYIRRAKTLRVAGATSLMLLVLLGLATILPYYNAFDPNHVNATTTTENLTPGDTSISITADSNIVLPIIPNSSYGTFNSNTSTVSVTATNPGGYTLSLATRSTDTNNDTDNTSLVNNDDGTNKFVSITENITSTAFSQDNATGAALNGKWGYLFYKSGSTGADLTTFKPSPSTGSTASLDATGTQGTTNYTLGIGARAGLDLPAGTYSNTFVLTATANPISYTFNLKLNDGTANNFYTQEGSTYGTVASIYATAPVRDGYEFKGWCSTTTSDDTCSGTTYQPGAEYTIDVSSASSTADFYAMWKSAAWGYIQDFTLTHCSTLASDSEVKVIDRRDGSDYTVRYINDACWMTQNLRITKSTGQADWTISSTDSNFTRVYTWNVHVSDLSAGNSYTEARSHVPTATDADTDGNKPMDTYTAEQIGAWYNYCAASAGQVCSQTKTSATQDICPKNWHLPSYNTAPGAFSGMTGTVTLPGGTNNASYFNPIYGGYWYSGSLNSATTNGYWWSATAYSISNQYRLYYYDGSLNTGSNLKGRGLYIRCTRTDDGVMQDFTSDDFADMEVGETRNLADSRTGTLYTVKMLELNGTKTLWMMSNLQLPKTASITPGNSNVTSTYTALFSSGNWTSSSQDDYCKPYMAVKNGEYYYNWPAATARTNSTSDTSSCSNDTSNSVGDICPKGWRLPTSTEIDNRTWRSNLVSNGSLATTGIFISGSQNFVGSFGNWWASTRSSNSTAYRLYLNGSSADSDGVHKYNGLSVRCLRTS